MYRTDECASWTPAGFSEIDLVELETIADLPRRHSPIFAQPQLAIFWVTRLGSVVTNHQYSATSITLLHDRCPCLLLCAWFLSSLRHSSVNQRMLSLKVRRFLIDPTAISCKCRWTTRRRADLSPSAFILQCIEANGDSRIKHALTNVNYFRLAMNIASSSPICASWSLVRLSVDQEIDEHQKKGRLPTTFTLNDAKYYQALSRIRGRSDRLAYLRSLIPIINTPPVFAVPVDSGGIHRGFLSPFRVLRQPDLVDMSTWNYLKARRLEENLFFHCSGVLSLPLAQLLIDMRAKFNLLSEPWWPILVGLSQDTEQEVMDILQTKHQLHGSPLYAWEARETLPNTKDLTLMCANRGETIYEMDPNINYMVQIDADEKQCCLGNATSESDHLYRNVVKLESRIK